MTIYITREMLAPAKQPNAAVPRETAIERLVRRLGILPAVMNRMTRTSVRPTRGDGADRDR